MVTHGNVPRPAALPFTEAQLQGFFKNHDKNKDNRLSKAELKEAFGDLGALFPGWRAWRGMAIADSNGDGFISEDEMNELIHYAFNLGYKVH